MKFFEKRGVALVVLMLAIAGAVFIGQSRKDGFIAKKPRSCWTCSTRTGSVTRPVC